MAAEVLAASARSLTLDLEPWQAFWEGTPETARVFGEELRRLQPYAKIITSIDPRPWTLNDIPINEFVAFSNALAPTIYWETFDSPQNRAEYAQSGYPPPEEKAAPEFFLDATADALRPYGLPVQPVGQGNSDTGRWARFVDHATAIGLPNVSVWRYGVVGQDVRALLGERTPSGQLYVVQSGDTLSRIGQLWGVDAMRIATANRLADPNVLFVGQELCVPLAQ
jgi:LysM repeat protein